MNSEYGVGTISMPINFSGNNTFKMFTNAELSILNTETAAVVNLSASSRTANSFVFAAYYNKSGNTVPPNNCAVNWLAIGL